MLNKGLSSVKNPNRLHINDTAKESATAERSTVLAETDTTGSTSEGPVEATMRCPACRAQQIWSPECRRCGADLMMLRQFENTCYHQRCLSLTALRDGRNQAATRHASRLYQLQPDADSARLLAVCLLISGNFVQACRIAGLHES